MKVGLVCPYSLSVPGGVQGQVLGLAAALRAEGVEARVLGPCDGPPPDANVTPLGNSIPTSANGSMAPIAPDPSCALRVIRALRDEAFDVVHLHEPLVPGPTLTAMLFGGFPMVGTFHRSGAVGYRRWSGAGRIAVRNLDYRCAVSEQAMQTAVEIFGGAYEVVWNGIDIHEIQATPPWPRPADPSTRVVLFVGRHEPRKGLAVLVDAMGRLGPSTRLWVVGEGPETARLKAATTGDRRIEWLGVVSEAEKRARLRAADVFCAPSLSGESFGVVLLEGMAAGAVVVATDLAGYATVARPGSEGLIVPPGDAGALAAALAQATRGGPEIDRMVQAGGERAEHFSMRRLALRYLGIYEGLLRHPRPAPSVAPTIGERARRALRPILSARSMRTGSASVPAAPGSPSMTSPMPDSFRRP